MELGHLCLRLLMSAYRLYESSIPFFRAVKRSRVSDGQALGLNSLLTIRAGFLFLPGFPACLFAQPSC